MQSCKIRVLILIIFALIILFVSDCRGYLAPEYALLGQLTKKADIYSFGVLVLEIISGRSSSKAAFGKDLLVLVEWTWKLRDEGRLLDIVDPELTEYPEDEVMRFIKVALFCTQAASHQRPGMKQVVEMLSKEVTLNEKLLTEPGVYRTQADRRLVGGRPHEKTSSTGNKGKQSADPFETSTQLDGSHIVTQMLPR
ncbi:non-specific serine,threonine protein kinase [Sarracenia purpurea var. burkii]